MQRVLYKRVKNSSTITAAFLAMLAGFCFFPVPGEAQQIIKFFHVQSGTGFFVNNQYVITNAHVVNGCSEVIVKGAVTEHKADVKVMDAQDDLALLETTAQPQQFAPLRFNIDDLKTGDKVFVIGYPGAAGARGEYSVATAQIEDMHEIKGSTGRFYITDVVEHGNSGGPVFDTSGNVIGVVVAKSTLYTVNLMTNQKLAERHVGVVISLATLKQFLFDHGVFTEWLGSNVLYADSYIEDSAKNYIVNVQCRTPAGSNPSQGDATQQPETVIYGR